MQLNLLPTTLLALLPLASAGYSYGGSSSAGASSGSTVGAADGTSTSTSGVHIVNVGKGGLVMDPADIKVPVGEVIEFHFFTGNHNVAQSAFGTPCQPLAANGSTPAGFFSGSVQVASGESSTVFRVTSTGQPMWYYCGTARHCQSGMVGVVNAPANGQRTLAQYKTAAAAAANNVLPASVGGGVVGQVSTSGSGTGTGTGTGSGSGTGSNSTTTTPNAGAVQKGDMTIVMTALTIAMAGVFGGLLV